MMPITGKLLLLIPLGLSAGHGLGAEPAGLAGQLAQRDSVPASYAAFESEYAPRVNFGALLEPATGIIHGAGQDPESYLEYSDLFGPANRPMMQMN